MEQQFQFGLRLGVAGQQQLAAVSGGNVQINHLHGGELFDGAARRQTGGQRMEPAAERDVEAIGEEGDKDMRLDAHLVLMKDRANGEITFKVAERFLDADELEIE